MKYWPHANLWKDKMKIVCRRRFDNGIWFYRAGAWPGSGSRRYGQHSSCRRILWVQLHSGEWPCCGAQRRSISLPIHRWWELAWSNRRFFRPFIPYWLFSGSYEENKFTDIGFGYSLPATNSCSENDCIAWCDVGWKINFGCRGRVDAWRIWSCGCPRF